MSNPFNPISPITNNLGPLNPTPLSFNMEGPKTVSFDEEAGAKPSFQNAFAQALEKVNDTMMTAGDYSQKLATGELQNVHEMSIAGAKAEVMLHLTTQIAARVSSACTTLFQMQI